MASTLLCPRAKWRSVLRALPESGEPDYQRAPAANQGGCGLHCAEACYNHGPWSTLVAKPCQHPRTRLIAQDDATTYLECLECGELFEPAELDRRAPSAPEFDEDLSDA